MDGGLRILKSAIQVADPFELHRPNRRHPLSSLSPPPDRWRCSHHLSARKSCLVGRRSGILRLASSSSFCRLECNEDPEREKTSRSVAMAFEVIWRWFWDELRIGFRWSKSQRSLLESMVWMSFLFRFSNLFKTKQLLSGRELSNSMQNDEKLNCYFNRLTTGSTMAAIAKPEVRNQV